MPVVFVRGRQAMIETYPRDLIGYGRNPPDPRWPGRARVAVQFVLNYEEGGERSILHGDKESEAFLSDVLGAVPWPGQRHMNVESMYEYGSRARLRRRVAAVWGAQAPDHGVWSGACAGAQSGRGRGHAGGRLGDCEPRSQMDRLQGHAGSRGACRSHRGDSHSHYGHGRAAARVVHRPYL